MNRTKPCNRVFVLKILKDFSCWAFLIFSIYYSLTKGLSLSWVIFTVLLSWAHKLLDRLFILRGLIVPQTICLQTSYFDWSMEITMLDFNFLSFHILVLLLVEALAFCWEARWQTSVVSYCNSSLRTRICNSEVSQHPLKRTVKRISLKHVFTCILFLQ